jgi:tetratricopeptide (TPR) repeat protein
MTRKFSTAVLDTLLKTVEFEFKVSLLGFGEIKFPVSEHAKEWLKNEKAREDLLNAINVAEQRFVAENPKNKAAQILHDFSLKNEKEFQRVIAELLNHLDEQKITWLMAGKLGKGFEKIVSNKELQDALNNYIPYLRDELSRIREFREIITYLLQKQIASTTSLTYETTQEIKDLLLEQRTQKTENQPVFTPEVFTDIDKLPEPSDFLPSGSRMPFYRNKIFTGRESDLLALAKILLSDSDTSKNVVITQIAAASGMGGIGKTQLAVEFCYRYGKFFHGIHWINARDGNLEAEIAACGYEMGLPNFPQTTPEQVVATLQTWKTQPLRLIVLDNLEDPTLLANWFPRLNGLHLLVTARRQQYPPDLGIELRQLGILPRTDSLALLRKLSPKLIQTSDSELDPLAERLGDLPLALDLAGRYLTARPSLNIDEYLKQLGKQGNALNHTSLKNWAKDASPTAHETNLVATFLLSWKQLGNNKIDKLAKKFFVAAGFLAPSIPILETIFLLLSMPLEKKKKRVEIDQLKEYTSDAILRIQQLGLLTENLVIHPLLAEFARSLTPDKTILSDLAGKMAALSIWAVESDIPAAFAPLRHHVEILFTFSEQNELSETAQLINCLGYYHNTVAEYSAALIAYNRALELWEKKFGKEHHLIAVAYNNLGYTYHTIGDFQNAKQMFELAKDIDERIYGENHPNTGIRYNNLGSALADLGELSSARLLLEKALESDEKHYGEEHRNVSRDANSLGMILKQLGDLQGAKKLLEQALSIDEKILGDEHPDIVIHTNNMGNLLHEMGDFANAKLFYERSLLLAEKFFGKSHPIVAKRLQNFASLYFEMDDLPRAYDYANRSQLMYKKYLPSEHPDVRNAINWLNRIEKKMATKNSSDAPQKSMGKKSK